MLILTRRRNDCLLIGSDTRVRLISLDSLRAWVVVEKEGVDPYRLRLGLQESVHLLDNVSLKFLSTHGNQGKFGIDAPREVLVLREELATVPK